jgi:hypothetical protein
MDWLTFFSEISKSLAWPICLLILVKVFHKQISNFIHRIIKIDKEGITAISISEMQLEKPKPEAVQLLLDVVSKSVVIASIEEDIKNDLMGKGLETTGNTIDVLIRHLAGTSLLLSFVQIHSQIFGSQLILLNKLNEMVGQGRSVTFINDYFDHIKLSFPEAFDEWSVDQYLNYMFVNLLITQNENKIHITNKGVEYLTWIARNGIQDNKPL